jgi:hypothetical protein
MGKREGPVTGVGYGRLDAGSVVCAGGKLRSEGESADRVDGMMIWRSDGGLERRVMEVRVQTLHAILGWMGENN